MRLEPIMFDSAPRTRSGRYGPNLVRSLIDAAQLHKPGRTKHHPSTSSYLFVRCALSPVVLMQVA